MELKKLLYAVDLEDAPHPAIEHVKMVATITTSGLAESSTTYVPDGRFRFDRVRAPFRNGL